jgi:histidinol-phosphate phosphatase family domain/HAD-superfamily hydrolase, subfamily IIIA
MKAVIMAGGKGTRLRSLAENIPKPMLPISGKPVLEYQIENLKKSGIHEIILVVGYLKQRIKNYFEDGSKFGVEINYIEEKEPLGTAGAFFYLQNSMIEDFLLVFGDLIFDVDFMRFMNFHKRHEALITLYGHPNSHPYDSDIIIEDSKQRVIEILSKNREREFFYHNFTNAGLYCINPKVLNYIYAPEKIDLEKDIVSGMAKEKKVYAYRCTEYVKDIGTPERVKNVEMHIKEGLVAQRNLRNKQRAVFLDRDGTINRLAGFLKDADAFELLPNAAEAIRKLNASKYLAIVATNQPVIARGECSFEELDNIHKKMETELGKHGAYIDALFYCPHHPDRGFEGEVLSLKFECECRKPKTGMLEKAAKEYNIDLSESWYIGDSTVDIQTGKNAGTKTVLLHTGEAGGDKKYNVKADIEAKDLLDAIKVILDSAP